MWCNQPDLVAVPPLRFGEWGNHRRARGGSTLTWRNLSDESPDAKPGLYAGQIKIWWHSALPWVDIPSSGWAGWSVAQNWLRMPLCFRSSGALLSKVTSSHVFIAFWFPKVCLLPNNLFNWLSEMVSSEHSAFLHLGDCWIVVTAQWCLLLASSASRGIVVYSWI